ncbi:MAG: hypothetical protein HON68_11005 [Gammaproteobacteria bacterium]|jgi:hypothetical protein|nr:hypothetical protein [Gammaproteobacteria bacterium]MBT3719640.1 hypothetical protein [Gammaproteobacteria bacterium]MBT3844602.1 hypothetical protein [Gammaproteobacteria bacterium]MBT3892001.1 hypothetical protein [Gammaproteobacteria bacterium]MBT4299607.1 hypothetical protein [Gammaproteobacteria bacterium]
MSQHQSAAEAADQSAAEAVATAADAITATAECVTTAIDMSALTMQLNGLVIITSALFALAQYFDKDHKEEMWALVHELQALNFKDASTNAGIRTVKGLWDTFTTNPVFCSSRYNVVAIFSILIAYTFIHAALLTYNGAGKWVPGSLQLLSYFVIANALWLAVSLWRMGAERKERRARASLIRDQHKVALMAAGLHSSPDINMEEKAGTEH